jgi:hypothetical protein
MVLDPVSNIDRLMLILRQRLEERERSLRKGRPAKHAEDGPAATASGIDALAALDGADAAVLRRAFIQALLSDQFGRGMINEAPFQQVVKQVTDAIDSDPATQRLLSRLLVEVRASGSSRGPKSPDKRSEPRP